MAHFAKIENNGIVSQVIVLDNSQEHRGQDFINQDLGLDGKWIQTSYNNNFRKQYASLGYTYDEINDVFITPQPYPSWSLNENFDWQAPIPKPSPCSTWNEQDQIWIDNC
jgi:hypothetical protein